MNDIASEPGVDIFHHFAENHSVGRCVGDSIVMDIVVNHLVNDHIFEFLSIYLVSGIDTDAEVIVKPFPMRFFLAFESQLSEIVFGIAEFDFRDWQFAVEAQGVVLREDLLYVGNSDLHEVRLFSSNTLQR